MVKQSAKSAATNRLASIAVKLGGGGWLRALWPRLFPRKSSVFLERLTYGINNHGATEVDAATGEPGLRYFPRHESGSLEPLAFWELFDDHSGDNFRFKLTTIVLLSVQLAIPPALVFAHNSIAASFGSANYHFVLLIIAATAIAACVLGSTSLRVHFIQMDRDWQTSIQAMMAADIKAKMFGIKGGVSFFRQFIKWRRLMTYFFIAAGTYLILIEIPLFVWAYLTQDTIANWTFVGDWPLVAMVLIQIGCIMRFSYLVWLHTGVRDPTLQLCVMLVETDREIVAAMRMGARPT